MRNSIRPPVEILSDGGPGVPVGRVAKVRGEDELRRDEISEPCAMFPVQGADGVGEITEDEFMCQPCDEEEQAVIPGSLPSVYQPTRSEFLDHCVTHYPFRVWCRH